MKILVNWDYNRSDLMKAFAALQEEISFVFLYKEAQVAGHPDKVFNKEVIYWNHFENPYQILDQVKPDKVLFHDIESFLQVALNIAAKNRGIPTFVLEHGLRGDYEVDIALNSQTATKTPSGNKRASNTPAKKRSTLSFYLSAFRLKNISSVFNFFRFLFIRKKFGLTVGLYKCPFSLREADKYINFTIHNASYVMKRDHLPADKIIAIGNPAFDEIFLSIEKEADIKENYYLLIDAPYCEDEAFSMKIETKTSFYTKLNEFCLSKGSPLKIKLHPQSYKATYLPEHSNIEYLRETNLADLIKKAKGCFLVNLSTLSPLAMYYSSCIYFNSGINPYDKDLLESNFLPAYDFNAFLPSDLRFREVSTEEKVKIKKAYLYETDGKATERLKQILLG